MERDAHSMPRPQGAGIRPPSVNGTVIPALSQNDTNTNPHNPMYAIYQYGARGGLLNLIGSQSSMSGGNSMSPPAMVIAAVE